MEHPAAADEPVQDLAAPFVVEVEAQLLDAVAAAHQLAHRRARKAQRVRHDRRGARRAHHDAAGRSAAPDRSRRSPLDERAREQRSSAAAARASSSSSSRTVRAASVGMRAQRRERRPQVAPISTSPKPTTATSSGTRKPWSRSAAIAPIAISSLPACIAVNASPRRSACSDRLVAGRVAEREVEHERIVEAPAAAAPRGSRGSARRRSPSP